MTGEKQTRSTWGGTLRPQSSKFKVQSSMDFQLLPAGDLPNAAPTGWSCTNKVTVFVPTKRVSL